MSYGDDTKARGTLTDIAQRQTKTAMPNSQIATGVDPRPKGSHLMFQWCYREAGQNYLGSFACTMLASFRLCIFQPSSDR
jgi:hypothetical protein